MVFVANKSSTFRPFGAINPPDWTTRIVDWLPTIHEHMHFYCPRTSFTLKNPRHRHHPPCWYFIKSCSNDDNLFQFRYSYLLFLRSLSMRKIMSNNSPFNGKIRRTLSNTEAALWHLLRLVLFSCLHPQVTNINRRQFINRPTFVMKWNIDLITRTRREIL